MAVQIFQTEQIDEFFLLAEAECPVLLGLRLCVFDLTLIGCIDLLRERRWEDGQVGGAHARIST